MYIPLSPPPPSLIPLSLSFPSLLSSIFSSPPSIPLGAYQCIAVNSAPDSANKVLEVDYSPVSNTLQFCSELKDIRVRRGIETHFCAGQNSM